MSNGNNTQQPPPNVQAIFSLVGALATIEVRSSDPHAIALAYATLEDVTKVAPTLANTVSMLRAQQKAKLAQEPK